MAILLALIVIMLAMLLYRCVRQKLLEEKTNRCRQLRELFISFGQSNQLRVVSNTQIQAFRHATSDISVMFASPTLEKLRIELHDNALRLQLIKWAQNSDISKEIAWATDQYEYDMWVEWFKQKVASMEATFNAEMQQPLKAIVVFAECGNLARKYCQMLPSINWRT